MKTASSIFLTFRFFVFICCCASFRSTRCLRRVWQRLIALWTTAVFRSHPAIDRFPVDTFIFFCCSTLFAIAFLCDLKYVSRMSVSDFKNVFKCTKRNSLSGRAFFLKRCNFCISDCNCRRLKSSYVTYGTDLWYRSRITSKIKYQ